jgi:hypothetical protein
MADSKNHFVNKQDETVVEVDVPGKNLKVLIPDNRYAYGDTESVAQIAQDVVGKHSNDEGAKGAYEQAREQLETTNFEALKRENAIKRLNAKKPKFTLVPDEDSSGVLRGMTVLTILNHPSGLQEMKEIYYPVDQLMHAIGV